MSFGTYVFVTTYELLQPSKSMQLKKIKKTPDNGLIRQLRGNFILCMFKDDFLGPVER